MRYVWIAFWLWLALCGALSVSASYETGEPTAFPGTAPTAYQ